MRELLLNNLKDVNTSDLKNIIEDGITSKEESILVGLGVLFEKYYQSLNNENRNKIISEISLLIKD